MAIIMNGHQIVAGSYQLERGRPVRPQNKKKLLAHKLLLKSMQLWTGRPGYNYPRIFLW
jgi:hypothetical protein